MTSLAIPVSQGESQCSLTLYSRSMHWKVPQKTPQNTLSRSLYTQEIFSEKLKGFNDGLSYSTSQKA